MTPRSLVGMTMGARKRAALYKFLHTKDTDSRPRREQLRKSYRIGQKLRPCPGKHGCVMCSRTCGACEDVMPNGKRCLQCGSVMTTEGPFCDGSGVVSAKTKKVPA